VFLKVFLVVFIEEAMVPLVESQQERGRSRTRPGDEVEDQKNARGSSKGKSLKRSKAVEKRGPTPEYHPPTRRPATEAVEPSQQSKNGAPSRETKKGDKAGGPRKSKEVAPAETQPKVSAEKQSRVPEAQQGLKGKVVKRKPAEAEVVETPRKKRATTPPGCSGGVPKKDTRRRETVEKDKFVTPETSKQVT
jgi:hypothetical protein